MESSPGIPRPVSFRYRVLPSLCVALENEGQPVCAPFLTKERAHLYIPPLSPCANEMAGVWEISANIFPQRFSLARCDILIPAQEREWLLLLRNWRVIISCGSRARDVYCASFNSVVLRARFFIRYIYCFSDGRVNG